jgi:MFS family permease
MFIVSRFFAGAGAFMNIAAVPILMTEIVPVHIRGALVDIHAVFFVFGFAISGWVGFGFYFWDGGDNTWRPPIAIQCFFPLCMLLGLFFVPESPRWLMMQDREEQAKEAIFKLHGNVNDASNDLANAEFYQIKKQIAIDRTLGNSWWHMWKKPSYRKRAFIAIGITGSVQCCGGFYFGPLAHRWLSDSILRTVGDKQLRTQPLPVAWLLRSQTAPLPSCLGDPGTWCQCYSHVLC